MSFSVFEMHSVQLFCQKPLGARYVICDEWHYTVCLKKIADLAKAKAQTRQFLDIAQLNRSDWARDANLLKRLIDRHWLSFYGVRDLDLHTEGGWVIRALLDEVRRGALLAIKGPRADLFPQIHGTPLTILTSRVGRRPNDEHVLSGRYDPRAGQTRLTLARTAISGGSSDGLLALTAAGTVVDALAGNGGASTLFRDAQPFEHSEDVPTGDRIQTAWLPSRGGPPNQWLENTSGKKQWRLYDGNGNAVVDIDFGHDHGFGTPHSHNWSNGVRDNGNAFSLLPR